MSQHKPFGIVGVFASPDDVLQAARQLRAVGLRAIEAYTPYPVEGLDEMLRPGPQVLLPFIMFVGAVLGAMWGYFVLVWGAVLNYPLNVGGRPYHSWPAFVVGAFEFMLLCAIAAGFFSLLVSCRLPRLYHPIFAADDFERASIDRFILCVEAHDPSFEPHRIRRIFQRHGAERVSEVPA